MTKTRIIPPVEIDEDGNIELNFDASEASTDWLKYGRLSKLAEEGDEEARRELERMESSEMIEEIDEDEEDPGPEE
ncbi:MAG: hypothetical protein JXR66_03250 [Bacteroidales bacterium]|nr:hypothetical protein [Bacteroidales bacterium]MBN2632546.1 hypothetical protein [Bacteroidales bacterium]